MSEIQYYHKQQIEHMRAVDALRFYFEQSKDAIERGFNIDELNPLNSRLVLYPEQFAASVLLRYFETIILDFIDEMLLSVEYNNNGKTLAFKFEQSYGARRSDCHFEAFDCRINPFVHMTYHNGTPRTNCTVEEFREWIKELNK